MSNIENDYGETNSILDTVQKDYASSESNYNADKLDLWLKQIDEIFFEQQERIKEYLSSLLLRQLLEEMNNAKIDSNSVIKFLDGKSFANTENAKRVIESFLSDEDFVTQGEVAGWFNRDKTDASRTMKEFLKKVEDLAERLSTLLYNDASR